MVHAAKGAEGKEGSLTHHYELAHCDIQTRLMVLDALPAACTVWQGTKLMYCNQSAADMFGLKNPQEYIDSFEELSPARQPCGTPSMEKALEHVNIAFETGFCKFEWMHQTLDGVPIPAEVTLRRVSWQEENAVVGHAIDLSEAKESFEMLTKLIDAAPVFMEIWDSRLNLVGCNEHARRLLKTSSRDDFIHDNAKFYPKYQPCGTESKEKEAALQKQALRDGYVKFDFVLHATDGEEIPLEYIYVLIRLRKKAYIVGYGYDLRNIRQPSM